MYSIEYSGVVQYSMIVSKIVASKMGTIKKGIFIATP